MYLEERMKELENDVSFLTQKMTKLDAALALTATQTFVSTNEAAKKLHRSRSSILDQIRKGKIIAVKTCSGSKHSRYKISETEINRIINL